MGSWILPRVLDVFTFHISTNNPTVLMKSFNLQGNFEEKCCFQRTKAQQTKWNAETTRLRAPSHHFGSWNFILPFVVVKLPVRAWMSWYGWEFKNCHAKEPPVTWAWSHWLRSFPVSLPPAWLWSCMRLGCNSLKFETLLKINDIEIWSYTLSETWTVWNFGTSRRKSN